MKRDKYSASCSQLVALVSQYQARLPDISIWSEFEACESGQRRIDNWDTSSYRHSLVRSDGTRQDVGRYVSTLEAVCDERTEWFLLPTFGFFGELSHPDPPKLTGSLRELAPIANDAIPDWYLATLDLCFVFVVHHEGDVAMIWRVGSIAEELAARFQAAVDSE